MRVLVLGAYGFIGLPLVRALKSNGLEVVCFGRSQSQATKAASDLEWRFGDLTELTEPSAWYSHLAGVDTVVNATGALQSAPGEDLKTVQNDAIQALAKACEEAGVRRIVQISAAGVSGQASTEFFRSKSQADEALMASNVPCTIFRPGLVIGSNAFGGTSLLRMLAGIPLVQPLVHGQSSVQTVYIDDIAQAVVFAVQHNGPDGIFELVEERAQPLADVVGALRSWQGFAPPRWTINLPPAIGMIAARFADLAGLLGWRPALRTTALRVLEDGITGSIEPWRKVSGQVPRPLDQTFESMTTSAQERLFARAALVFPLALITLSLFWMMSGIIGLMQFQAAVSVLNGRLPRPMAQGFVLGGYIADIAIGVALLYRPWTRHASMASLVVALGYLAAASFVTPWLWADPLGPMVKVLPALALSLIVMALAEKR